MSVLIWIHTFGTLIVFMKEFFEKVNFEKSADDEKIMKNYPACKEIMACIESVHDTHFFKITQEFMPSLV